MIDKILWRRIVNEIIECIFSQFPEEARRKEEYENISFRICLEVYNREINKRQNEIKKTQKKMLKRFDEIHNGYMMKPFGVLGAKSKLNQLGGEKCLDSKKGISQ